MRMEKHACTREHTHTDAHRRTYACKCVQTIEVVPASVRLYSHIHTHECSVCLCATNTFILKMIIMEEQGANACHCATAARTIRR